MNLAEAIETAMVYERKIRDVYAQALPMITDPAGRRIIEALRVKEQYHLDYLRQQLQQWRATGRLSAESLGRRLPSREELTRASEKFGKEMSVDVLGDEKQILSRALQVEIETSAFYRRMTTELSAAGRALFEHFLEIEDDHITAVQIELDYLNHSGYWFDFKEFDME